MLGVLLLHDAIVLFEQAAPIPCSEFQRLLREGKGKEVVVTPGPYGGMPYAGTAGSA